MFSGRTVRARIDTKTTGVRVPGMVSVLPAFPVYLAWRPQSKTLHAGAHHRTRHWRPRFLSSFFADSLLLCSPFAPFPSCSVIPLLRYPFAPFSICSVLSLSLSLSLDFNSLVGISRQFSIYYWSEVINKTHKQTNKHFRLCNGILSLYRSRSRFPQSLVLSLSISIGVSKERMHAHFRISRGHPIGRRMSD